MENIEQAVADKVRRTWDALWAAQCQSPRDVARIRTLSDAYREVRRQQDAIAWSRDRARMATDSTH